MKIKSLARYIASFAAVALFGCGGGGGGESAPAAPPAGSTTISGAAVKGPLSGSDVTVFAVRNNQVDRTTILVTGKTAADGSYSLVIPPSLAPSGPIMVEVSGGTFSDEATGTAGVTLKTPLRAVVSSAANGDKIFVTPLTDLAYKKAEGAGAFSAANIDDANQKIGQAFGVDNIIRSHPFDATKPAPASATADDKRYATALGVFSQMVADKRGTQSLDDALVTVLTQLETEVHDTGGLSPATVASYNTAAAEFASKVTGGTPPTPIAFTAGVLVLRTAGTLAAGTAINGLDITITLPAGVTVRADGVTGEVSSGVVVASGVAVNNSFSSAKYTPASGATPGTVRLILLNVQPGFALGEFARVNFDGFPASGTFDVTVNSVSGGSDPQASPGPLSGVSVTNTFSGL